MVELLPDPFLINQNGAYLWINSLTFYIVWFTIVYQVQFRTRPIEIY